MRGGGGPGRGVAVTPGWEARCQVLTHLRGWLGGRTSHGEQRGPRVVGGSAGSSQSKTREIGAAAPEPSGV